MSERTKATDRSALNARTARPVGGTSSLMYCYSVTVIENRGSAFGAGHTMHLLGSDLVYSESGMRATDFGMYSYHLNDPQRYLEDRIEYEAYCKADLVKALAKYLTEADLREAALDRLGIL